DQRENRAAAAQYARGRLLDCFTYTGGFALALAPKCREVIAYDVSEDAIARVKQNAVNNGLTGDARVGNVFDELRGLQRRGRRAGDVVREMSPHERSLDAASRPQRTTVSNESD